SVSSPYSSEYTCRTVRPGSLPNFRAGTNDTPQCNASGAPNRKPRDSIPTTASGRGTFAPRDSIAARNASGDWSMGMMSLNLMPFFGKSGTSRTWSSRRIMRRSAGSLPWAGGSVDDLAVLAVHVREVDGAAQLRQRARLDLAHALARDAEVLAGLGKRPRDAVVEAVPDAQHLFLALRQRAQQPIQLLVLELQLDQPLDAHRGTAQVLGRELLERGHAVVLVERLHAREQRPEPLGACGRDVQLVRDLAHQRLAREPGAEHALGAHVAVELLEHLHRDAHRARLLGEPAQDRLADPQRSVRAEAQAALRLEAVHGVDQSQVPLLDQVEERQPAVAVGARHVHDQPEVGEDHPAPGVLVAGARARRGLEQLGVREQLHLADLVQVEVEQVALGLAGQLPRLERDRGLLDVIFRQAHARRHESGAERLERLVLEVRVQEQRVVVAPAHLAARERGALRLGEPVPELDDVRCAHAFTHPTWKPCGASRLSNHCSLNCSTRASRGPVRSAATKFRSAAAGPTASTSTPPSSRFQTRPLTPSDVASRLTQAR